MFSVTTAIEMNGRCVRHALFDGVEPVSYRTVIELWQENGDFRFWFADVLRSSSFACFRWETPPVTLEIIDRSFEFVLIDAPEIDMPADPEPFIAYFKAPESDVLGFENLGGDAFMVVPVPVADESLYPQLAAFLRGAPASQIDALWQSVGDALAERLGREPVWLSTAGGGVAWLHVRVDSRPKYYSYESYKQFPD